MATISFNSTSAGKKSPQSEADIQKLCWQHLSTLHLDYNKHTLQDYAYMVPNGTQLAGGRERRGMAMANLKSQGFRPGVSDIVIAYPTYQAGYHGQGGGADAWGHFGAYIELKRNASGYGGPKAIKSRRTAVRPEQRDWINLMLERNYWSSIAWGFEDFKRLIKLFLAGESPPPLDWDERK